MPLIRYSYLLFLKWCACLYSDYHLDEETPSFAIHGINLAKLGSITIYGSNGSDFLIDFSQRDCANRPDHLINNESPDELSQIIPCLDPFPLSINDGIPDKDKCKEVIPHNMDFTQLMYLCSFKIVNTGELMVKVLEEAVSLEYAISFRVSQWVDESRRIYVFPTTSDLQEYNIFDMGDTILMHANTIATIVLSPSANRGYEPRGIRALLSILYGSDSDFPCFLFAEEEGECLPSSSYSIYVGADPGLFKNPKHVIYDGVYQNEINRYVRSSVISVFLGDRTCRFCLFCNVSLDGAGELDSTRQNFYPTQLISSYNYLWKFDDPNDFRGDQDITVAPKAKFFSGQEEWNFEIIFTSMEGVVVNLIGYRYQENQQVCEGQMIVIYNESYVRPPVDNQGFLGSCMRISWQPRVPEGERFGFSAILSSKRMNITKEDCDHTYELTNEDPHFIINFGNFALEIYLYQQIFCIVQACPSESGCPLLIDITMRCDIRNWVACEDTTRWEFLEINNEIPLLTDCTSWDLHHEESRLIQCQTMIIDHQIILRATDIPSSITVIESVVSVRALQWIDDESDFYLLADFDPIALTLPAVPRFAWFSMSMEFSGSPQTLTKFREDHSHKRCKYSFINGPPDYQNLHPEQHLFTFD